MPQWTEQDHPRAQDGKFGSGGGSAAGQKTNPAKPAPAKPTPADPEKKANAWLAKAKAVPAAALNAARTKVSTTYQKLEGRYGKTHARLILASGLAGVPLPIPGSSFLTAAPFIAIAELHRRLSAKKVTAQAKYGALTPEQIRKLGQQFIQSIVGNLSPKKEKHRYAATMGAGNAGYVPSLGSTKKKFSDGEFITEVRPIFDEHKAMPHEEWDTTPEVLQRIIDQFNRRVADTEDYPVVTAGHTPEDGEDKPEPEVLGFAEKFDMGQIGKVNPRKAIIATLKIFKDKAAMAKRLPRCSVELWPDMVVDPIALKPAKQPIDTISLLGAERPARDLGLHYSKISSGKAKYQLNPDMEKEPMTPEEVKQIVMACLAEHEGNKQREAEAKQAAEAPAEYDEAVAGDQPPAEEVAPEAPAEEEEAPDAAKVRMQLDQEKRRYARLEADYTRLKTDVDGMKRTATVAQRKADLMQLEAEGIQFDMADELGYVSDMEPVRYSKHLATMKKNYKKAPVNVNIPVAAPNHNPSNDPRAIYGDLGFKTFRGMNESDLPAHVRNGGK